MHLIDVQCGDPVGGGSHCATESLREQPDLIGVELQPADPVQQDQGCSIAGAHRLSAEREIFGFGLIELLACHAFHDVRFYQRFGGME